MFDLIGSVSLALHNIIVHKCGLKVITAGLSIRDALATRFALLIASCGGSLIIFNQHTLWCAIYFITTVAQYGMLKISHNMVCYTVGWVNCIKILKLKNIQFMVNSFYQKMERHFKKKCWAQLAC